MDIDICVCTTPLFSAYSLSQGVPHFKTKHETKFFFLWFTILYLRVSVVPEPERGLAVGSSSQSSEGWTGVGASPAIDKGGLLPAASLHSAA